MKNYEEGIFQLLDEKKEEVEKKGKKVYNLSVGTPDFKPAQHIMDAVVEASGKPENYKYSLKEIPELVQAVIERYEKRYQVALKPTELTAVYGSQEGIAHIGLSLCNPGDGVLVPDPGYPIFSIGPSLAMAQIVTYPLLKENHYLPDLKGMDEEIRKKAKFMIVSYPLNPICKIAPDSFYEELIPWAKENNIIIVHDNAYSDIIYDGHVGKSILAFDGAKDICVEFYSLSKSFNYTGVNHADVLIPDAALRERYIAQKYADHFGSIGPFEYTSVMAAYTPEGRDWQQKSLAYMDGNRRIVEDFFRTRLAPNKVYPMEGAFVGFIQWRGLKLTGEALHRFLEKEAMAVLEPGDHYAQAYAGYSRISLGSTHEQTLALLERIEAAIRRHPEVLA